MPEINGQTAISGTIYGTLSVRHGADGKDGQDGFSPRIVAIKDTETEYVLRITDVDGSFDTPNLLGGGKQGVSEEEVKRLIAGKLDADLSPIALLEKPTMLTTAQRESAMLYLHRETEEGGVQNKLSLSTLALKEEVDDAIAKKVRTVSEQPKDWKVGDYIFLEIPREDRE